jgi:integrase
MTRKNGLPPRVYLRHHRFFLVTLAGKWLPLTREKDGLPAMYRALAALQDNETTSDLIPAVAARWLTEAAADAGWSAKHLENQERYAKVIGDGFQEFVPRDATTLECNRFLKQFAAKPRTFNAYRTALRGILALAAREGLREGYDPLASVPKKRLRGRHRMVGDAEIAKLRAAALVHKGKDDAPDKAVRNGKALVQMIDLALLTGRRISDLIALRWQDVSKEGIYFEEGKGQGRSKLLVQWSRRLRAAIKACERGDRIGHVLQKESGGPYRYGGIRSAWVRACERAGIEDLHIHDFKGRSGVDAMGDDEDVKKAQRLLGHTTEAMTRHYIEGKYAKRTKPAR